LRDVALVLVMTRSCTSLNYRLEDLDASVVLGAHRAFKTEKQQQRFEIMDLFPHPQFDSDSKENDIMLLKVLLITTVLLQKKYC